MFQRDGGVDAKVWPRTSGRRSVEGDIDGYGAVHCRGINADDMAGGGPVPSVDDGTLIKLNVPGLRFGDLDFSLEFCGIGDARYRGTYGNLLSDLKRLFISKALQHAGDTRAHL